jgi:hypothetical protein
MLALWPSLLVVAAEADGCSPFEATAGICTSGTIEGETAVLTGTDRQHEPRGGTSDFVPADPNCAVLGAATDRCLEVGERAGIGRPVTLADIAAFRPTSGIERMEPDGWVVPGLSANIYAIVGQHLVDGTLLGQPATVRFTPIRYHWDYGDGTTAIRTSKGGTWAALGLREFDATPTSHVYLVEGEYTIHLTIDFRAEYRFAGSAFLPIDGSINLRANDLYITVDGAKTVLVERDCAADPSGPGC